MGDRLSGRIALVMGAGSSGPGWGNGKAAAVTYAREGARVVCADIDAAAAAETAALVEGEGGTAVALTVDVSRAVEVESAVRTTVERFGRIDVLLNNVGITGDGGVTEISEEDWDRVFAVNVKSAFLAMKYAIPHMRDAGGGSVINVSSIASLRHLGPNYCTYYSTKAALNHLSRTTAVEFAPYGVRVNSILPGLMKTPMVENAAHLAQAYADGDVEEMWRRRDAQVPMGHMGDAWDVAAAALFLASDESTYITGLDLVVDGGLTLRSA
nr:SDR family oxidoreductase [Pseudonocardia alni]